MPKAPRGALAVIILGALIIHTPTALATTTFAASKPGPSSNPQTSTIRTTGAQTWADVARQVRSSASTEAPTAGRSTAHRTQQAKQAMRCFQLEQENYCLGLGFVDKAPNAARIAAAVSPVAASAAPAASTGAISVTGFVAQRAALSSQARLTAELDEMQTAWDGRAKARSLRTGAPSSGYSTQATPPAAYYLMYGYATTQDRSFWCGPATMQSIDWGDDKVRDAQTAVARSLGTTTSGTAITAIVKQTNVGTNWDLAAGTYITQGVSTWTWQKFFTIHQTHLGDGTPGPIIEHPQLLKRYFPYLRYDHSGHFQVGRGYAKSNSTISIFEVFNERRWNSSGYNTSGIRYVPASSMFSATLANQFQNIGL